MLCQELERLEGEFDDIVDALDDPALSQRERDELEQAYTVITGRIKRHRDGGHNGGPCYEEE